MKKIEAIIRPEKVAEVIGALETANYPGVTVSEVQGHGKQRGVTEQWRGQKYQVTFLPKVKLEIVVKDSDLQKIIKVVGNAARTNSVGDGKMFVSDVADVIRIRTDERGEVAVG